MAVRFFSLFGSTPAEFPSDFPLDESVERLRAVVKRSIFQTIFEEAAVGKVRQDRVSIRWNTPTHFHGGSQDLGGVKRVGFFGLRRHRHRLDSNRSRGQSGHNGAHGFEPWSDGSRGPDSGYFPLRIDHQGPHHLESWLGSSRVVSPWCSRKWARQHIGHSWAQPLGSWCFLDRRDYAALLGLLVVEAEGLFFTDFVGSMTTSRGIFGHSNPHR